MKDPSPLNVGDSVDFGDFVGIEGKISSPWREHLIQRFSHSFARIGLDGATSVDHAKLASSI